VKRNEQKVGNIWKTEDIFKDEAASLAFLDTYKELGNELCDYDGKLGNASNLLWFLKGYEKLTCLLGD
jgi:oligoendopeptidase F